MLTFPVCKTRSPIHTKRGARGASSPVRQLSRTLAGYHFRPGGTREGLPVDETSFGRYRLLSVIGQGGMGKVYKAHDTVIDREVAIKILATDLGAEPGYQERFRREAQMAARLAEPHIIPVYDTGEIDGQLYLVMPIVEGTDIQDLLRNGPMSPQRAVRLVEQLAEALHAAHRVGLVHRDVKPSNALVTGNDFLYLIDFGIAHNKAATKLTHTGTIIGSWAYMAPERFTTGTSDASADIYALACVLHECLTGSQPYPGDSLEQQFTGHFSLDPPRPSRLNSTVPPGFDEVIARGMAKEPGQRYPSATDLAAAAQDALANRHVSAPTLLRDAGPTVPVNAPRPVQHRPAYHPNPAPAQFAPSWGQAPPPAPTEWPSGPAGSPPAPQRRRAGLIAAIVAAVVVLTSGIIGAGYLFLGHSDTPQTPTAQPPPPSSPISSASAAPAPPPPASELDGLLLSADQINTAMATNGMSVVGTMTTMSDKSAFVSDKACAPLAYAVEASAYAGSGSGAVRAQVLSKGQQDAVNQAIVSFSSPQDAASFYNASAQKWGTCKQFTISINGNSQLHNVGPVSNTNGILSATVTPVNSLGSCQRALTVANNVAVDVTSCLGPADAAVDIARQIAAKVPKS